MHVTAEDIIDFLKMEVNTDFEFRPDSILFSSGMLDSASMVNLIMFIEEKTQSEVRASDVTLENFDTPQRIQAYVEARE
jgi:acyl carrier protein